MNRMTFLGTAGSALTVAALPRIGAASETGVSLETPTGTLYGTLAMPQDAAGAVAVALIIAGSGPVDRDGNSGAVQANTYALLASALAQRGMASVRYDKRGVGQSRAAAPPEEDLRFETYVDDAAAWLRRLRADRRFSKTVAAGHSEGSLVGMVALQHASADAFVSLEGAGRPAAELLRDQLKTKISPDLDAQSDAIVAQLEEGHTVMNPPQELYSLFRPSVQPYLISLFRYDPAEEIAKLHLPATIVQGTADVQVSVEDAYALKRADPNARLIVVQGMNHMLRHAPDTSSRAAILRGYEDASLPVESQVIDAVASAV
jgi:pimeloyl-ACP methyl ester carboxylesterase